MLDLAKFIDEKAEWSRRTFGDIEVSGILAHLRKELVEIEEDPKKIDEYIDVIFLALDGASRAGYSGEQIVAAWKAKHDVNLSRKWKKNADGHSEHIRDAETCDHKYPKQLSVDFTKFDTIKITATCSNCKQVRRGELL